MFLKDYITAALILSPQIVVAVNKFLLVLSRSTLCDNAV